MLLACSDGSAARTFLLTRRLTGRVINALARALAGSSRSVSHAPAEARREVLLLEHVSSISAASQPAGEVPVPVAAPAEVESDLVYKVDFEATDERVALVFHSAAEPLGTLSLTRPECHKFLAALHLFAQQGGWRLEHEADWLDRATHYVETPTGQLAS